MKSLLLCLLYMNSVCIKEKHIPLMKVRDIFLKAFMRFLIPILLFFLEGIYLAASFHPSV